MNFVQAVCSSSGFARQPCWCANINSGSKLTCTCLRSLQEDWWLPFWLLFSTSISLLPATWGSSQGREGWVGENPFRAGLVAGQKFRSIWRQKGLLGCLEFLEEPLLKGERFENNSLVHSLSQPHLPLFHWASATGCLWFLDPSDGVNLNRRHNAVSVHWWSVSHVYICGSHMFSHFKFLTWSSEIWLLRSMENKIFLLIGHFVFPNIYIFLYCLFLSQQTALLVEIPTYRNQRISSPVLVNFYICNGKRKRSQYQRFTYLPCNGKTLPSLCIYLSQHNRKLANKFRNEVSVCIFSSHFMKINEIRAHKLCLFKFVGDSMIGLQFVYHWYYIYKYTCKE